VSVKGEDGKESKLQAKNIVIATGSESTPLKGVDIDEKDIVSSTGALSFDKVPEHLVVVGAGVIGLELGSVWSRLGAKVTVVEFLDRILPGVDKAVATKFQGMLKKQGFEFKLSTGVQGVKKGAKGYDVSVKDTKKGTDEVIQADKVLVAIGRRPFTEGLGLEKLGIAMDGPRLAVDDHFRSTSHKSVYAIGDCIRGAMLAHKAEEEGIAAAEIIAGKVGHVNYDAIPGVIYTYPEVATVGKTEEDLKADGIAYNKGEFPFMANSRARTNQDSEGMVKILADKKTDRLLGVHIIGPNAGEMIAEAVIGIEYGASSEDLGRTCHAHPTLSEAFKEACMATYDKPIHF
jgi:dihydrolipoamide dehydrogenase